MRANDEVSAVTNSLRRTTPSLADKRFITVFARSAFKSFAFLAESVIA